MVVCVGGVFAFRPVHERQHLVAPTCVYLLRLEFSNSLVKHAAHPCLEVVVIS